MKKFFFVILRILSILIAGSSLAFAAVGDKGPASAYKVTITKFEIFNGTTWTTLFSGSSITIDIAAVDAGAVAGNFFTGLNVSDGSYTQVRVTVSDSFIISGRVGSLHTTAAKLGGACVSTATATDEAECTIDVPGGLPAPDPDVLPATLVVKDGIASHKIRVNFDVSTAVQEAAGNTLIPAEPTITMTMIPL